MHFLKKKMILHLVVEGSVGALWTGLYNPDSANCSDLAECTSVLKWTDGSDFLGGSWITNGVEVVDEKGCAIMENTDEIKSLDCGTNKKYLCQYSCPVRKFIHTVPKSLLHMYSTTASQPIVNIGITSGTLSVAIDTSGS